MYPFTHRLDPVCLFPYIIVVVLFFALLDFLFARALVSRYPLLSILMPTSSLPVGFLLIHDHVLEDNVAHSIKPDLLKRSIIRS